MNTLSCRCGRGRNLTNSEHVNCCEKKSYSSRCPCFKAQLSCSHAYKCNNCGNGNDKNPYRSHSKPEEREKGI